MKTLFGSTILAGFSIGAGMGLLVFLAYLGLRPREKKLSDRRKIVTFIDRQVAGVKRFGRQLIHTENHVHHVA